MNMQENGTQLASQPGGGGSSESYQLDGKQLIGGKAGKANSLCGGRRDWQASLESLCTKSLS